MAARIWWRLCASVLVNLEWVRLQGNMALYQSRLGLRSGVLMHHDVSLHGHDGLLLWTSYHARVCEYDGPREVPCLADVSRFPCSCAEHTIRPGER